MGHQMSQESPRLGHPQANSLRTTEAVQQLTVEAFSDIRAGTACCRNKHLRKGRQGSLALFSKICSIWFGMWLLPRRSPEWCLPAFLKMKQNKHRKMEKDENGLKEENGTKGKKTGKQKKCKKRKRNGKKRKETKNNEKGKKRNKRKNIENKEENRKRTRKL